MPKVYLKQATFTARSDAPDVHAAVQKILSDIETGGERVAQHYAAKFDGYAGNVVLGAEEIAAACALVPDRLKKDIQFAHDNVRRFAEAQKTTLANVEIEVVPGLIAGQKETPVHAAGCYVPGGRYSHVASAV